MLTSEQIEQITKIVSSIVEKAGIQGGWTAMLVAFVFLVLVIVGVVVGRWFLQRETQATKDAADREKQSAIDSSKRESTLRAAIGEVDKQRQADADFTRTTLVGLLTQTTACMTQSTAAMNNVAAAMHGCLARQGVDPHAEQPGA